MSDLSSKVKEIIVRRTLLQISQPMTSDIMFREIGLLRTAIERAFEEPQHYEFVARFINKHLPLGQRISEEAFGFVEVLENALIDRRDVPSAYAIADMNL